MTDINRQEFEDLKKQVRTLERKVEEQQKQIATLRRRTTTDASGSSSSTSTSSGGGTTEVPRSAVQRDVIEILRDESESGPWVEVDTIKNEASQRGHLRSKAKAVIRKWLNRGYLSGDIEERVRVEEWPSKNKPVDK